MHDKMKTSENIQLELEKTFLKLSKEEKLGNLLDREIAILEEELKNKTIVAKHFSKEIDCIERRLDLSNKSLSRLKTSNHKIRQEIDNCRLKNNLNKKIIKDFERELSDNAIKSKQIHKIREESAEKQNDYMRKLEIVRSKSAQQKNRTARKFLELSSCLADYKADNSVLNQKEQIACKPKIGTEFLSTRSLFTKISKHWKRKCMHKRTELDLYVKNINNMNKSVDKMREGTGIQDLESIVKVFIDSDHEYTKIVKYLSGLNDEIDAVKDNTSRIGKIVNDSSLKEQESRTKIQSLLADLSQKQRALVSKEKECDELQRLLKNQFESCIDIVKAVFRLSDLVTVFEEEIKESNLNLALQNVEDFANRVLMLNAYYKRENLGLAAVPLDLISPTYHSKHTLDISEMIHKIDEVVVEDDRVPRNFNFFRNRAQQLCEDMVNTKKIPISKTPTNKRTRIYT